MVRLLSRKMKDSGIEWIGEIPEDWEIVRNKNLFVINKNMVGDYFADYQLLSLTTKGVKEKDIDNPNGKLPESFSTYQVVNRNDIILCLFDIDVSAVFSGISDFEGMITSAYKIVKCEDMITPSYADYWFKFVGYDRVYKMYSKSLRYTINSDDFGFIGTVVPPLNQQIKIANFLDKKVAEIDHILEKTRESIEEYKKYKQSIITEAVTKGLNPDVKMKDSGIEWIGEIPEHWDRTKLKRILTIPITDGPHETPNLLDEGIPFISAEAIKNNKINFDLKRGYISIEDHNKFILKSKPQMDDIFMIKSGATTGNVALVETDEEFSIWSPLALIRCSSEMHHKYLFYYLQSSIFQFQIQQFWNYGTQQNIGMNVLGNLHLSYPIKEEQRMIADYIEVRIESINYLIVKKEQLLSDLEAYKKSLIYECVTGKREVV